MKMQLIGLGLAALMMVCAIPTPVPAETVVDSIGITTFDTNADSRPDSATVTVVVNDLNNIPPPNSINVKAKLFPPGKAADPVSVDFIDSDQKTVNNPPPMAPASFVFNLSAGATSGIGSYTILVEESNDDDAGSNYESTTRSVTLYQLDLNATFLLSVDQAEHLVGLGQNATYNFTLWNRGAAPDNYTVLVPLAPAPWLASGDKVSVAVNGGGNGTFTVTVAAPQAYFGYPRSVDLFVSVRSLSTSETRNNTIRSTIGLPDLQVSASEVSLSDPDPEVGDTVAFHARVRNNGTVAASNVLVNFSIFSSVLSSATIPYLAAGGASSAVNFTWTATPGSGWMAISADAGSNVAEFDTTNNAVTVEVIVRSAELVSYTTDFSTDPARLKVGRTAILSLLVHNEGTANATAFTVRITIDTFTQDRTVAGIPANGSAVVNFTYRVAQGAQTVNVILDLANTVGEEQEFDNNVRYQLTYNIPPVAAITVNHDSIGAKKYVIFTPTGSYDNDGSIAKYHYDFGDRTYEDRTNTTGVDHFYLDPGNYTVTLTVWDNDGAEGTNATVLVTVTQPGEEPEAPGFELLAVLGAAGLVAVLAGRRKRK